MKLDRISFVIMATLFPALLVAANDRLAIVYCMSIWALACIVGTVNDRQLFSRGVPTLGRVLLYSGIKLMNFVTIFLVGLLEAFEALQEKFGVHYFEGLRVVTVAASCYLIFRSLFLKRYQMSAFMVATACLFIPLRSGPLNSIPWKLAYAAVGAIFSILVYRGTVSHRYEI